MAYRDAVKYIEDMKPNYVNAVGDECLRTKAIIQTALPTLSGLPGNVDWRSDAAALYEQRLKETIELVEGLHDGFDKAGKAVADYVQAQRQAQARVADGVNAESQLHALIAPIVATQSFQVRFSDALRQWNDLRSTTGVTDWVIELPEHDEINKVRAEADELWYRATDAYDEAIRMESDARNAAVSQLAAAYRLLPDFLANSPLSAKIVAETPGLVDTHGKYHIGPPTAPKLTFDDDFPYDPDATPTPGDLASWSKWMSKLRGAQLFRADLDDATAAYDHYTDGTGTDMQVDYEEAYREDPAIGWAVDNGDQITMKIKVHAEDMYNFDLDASDIATEAPDEENGRFSTLGWAKGFRTHGELERTVTWTIGESPDISDGTGPERHVFGEDRPDGREDG